MPLKDIRSAEDIMSLVDEWGFLPFFKNDVEGFSIEDLCAPELWFSNELDGPWEWKGPIVRTRECMYGKLFGGKAGFVSRKWLPHFANFRRDGYDFDSRVDEGIAPFKDEHVFGFIAREGNIISKQLKRESGFHDGKLKGFDTVITRLQMQTYVCVSDFIYEKDKKGKTYGWGVAEYSTPEYILGEDSVRSAYRVAPEKSYEALFEHFKKILPGASDKQIAKFIER